MITRRVWILALSGLLVGSTFGVALANFVGELELLGALQTHLKGEWSGLTSRQRLITEIRSAAE